MSKKRIILYSVLLLCIIIFVKIVFFLGDPADKDIKPDGTRGNVMRINFKGNIEYSDYLEFLEKHKQYNLQLVEPPVEPDMVEDFLFNREINYPSYWDQRSFEIMRYHHGRRLYFSWDENAVRDNNVFLNIIRRDPRVLDVGWEVTPRTGTMWRN